MSAAGEGLDLADLEEPHALKTELRDLAEQQPARAREQLAGPQGLGGHLWDRWGDDLGRAGFDRESFHQVLDGYRRELWYWVQGDRTWHHCIEGLTGRLTRRATTRQTG